MIALIAAKKYTEENNMIFIPPFDDLQIIEGQATVGVEILEDLSDIDYLFVPVGGGGWLPVLDLISKRILPKQKSLVWSRKAHHL